MTGIIFDALASTWVGKLTYFRTSYWHQLLKTLDNEQNAYLNNGIECGGCLMTIRQTDEMTTARTLFVKTRNCESLKCPLLPIPSSYSLN